MNVFIVLRPFLLTTKLSYAQLFNLGHSNGQECTYPSLICYEQQCTDILISWCIADEELLKMVQDVSEDPVYHTIEFNEFLQLLSKQQRSGTTRDSLTDAFRFVSHFWPRVCGLIFDRNLIRVSAIIVKATAFWNDPVFSNGCILVCLVFDRGLFYFYGLKNKNYSVEGS